MVRSGVDHTVGIDSEGVIWSVGLDAYGQHVVDGVSFGGLGGMGGGLECVGVAGSNKFVHRDRPENGFGSFDQVVLGVRGHRCVTTKE